MYSHIDPNVFRCNKKQFEYKLEDKVIYKPTRP